MTKKMFQVSRWIAIGAVIFVCCNILMDQKVRILDGDIISRCFMAVLAVLVFWIVSVLYEKKRKVFSPGYLMLMVNVFINGIVCPCYFTESRLDAGTRDGVIQPQDFWELYLVIYFLTMFVVLLYLLYVKPTTDELNQKSDGSDFIQYDRKDDAAIFLMGIIVLFLNFQFGSTGVVMYVPVLCYFAMRFLLTGGKMNVYTVLGFLGGLFCIYRIRYSRYMIVEYVVPLLLLYFVLSAINDTKKRGKKVIPLLIAGVIAIMAYGMVSELIKLNTYWGRNYNLLYEITNFKSIIDSCARQIYRLFGIWTELGGNIIHHTNVHGYYYGITYVKFLSNILGFDYVSLPLISAKYISAAYAQPGLLAEGYANFGVIGAVVNLLVPFVLAEGALSWFLKKRDPLAICILTVPFTKILLDGGTINNIIFGVATCILAFALYIVMHLFKMKLRMPVGDLHLIRKKRVE